MRIDRPAVMAFGGKVKSIDRNSRDIVFMNWCMLAKKGSREYKCKSSNHKYAHTHKHTHTYIYIYI